MRTVLTAAVTAVIAMTITAAASHHHRHHRHHPHGTAATVHQRQHFDETWRSLAQGRFTDEEIFPNYHRRPTASAEALWREQHPTNIWLDFCYVDSYAACGRDSAMNHQRPGP